MRPEDFYMRSRASQGVRVELVDPAGSREWVRVRSVESDEFKKASRAVLLASIQEGTQLNGDHVNRKLALRRCRAELAAELIADWSLPMNEKSERMALLISNPRLRRSIERIAENHTLHFGAER